MKRVTLVKLFVSNQDEALEFYTKKLGFEVAEDTTMGHYRWLLVRLPDNKEFCINLDVRSEPTNNRDSVLTNKAIEAKLAARHLESATLSWTPGPPGVQLHLAKHPPAGSPPSP
jgi:catechol 2,3-dioxygenase-like lactoylglutathione lyase family enzyme